MRWWCFQIGFHSWNATETRDMHVIKLECKTEGKDYYKKWIL